MTQGTLLGISRAVSNGDKEQTLQLVQQALTKDIDPVIIFSEGLSEGLKELGERFGIGESFLFDMIAGADAAMAASRVLKPKILGRGKDVRTVGKFVIGTVQGDIHSIGKDIVAMMLRATGFEVIDLGVDVPATRFAEEVQKSKPDLLGLSALLTSTMDVQKEVINELDRRRSRTNVKVVVGGAPLTKSWAEAIGADAYGADAVEAIREAKALIGIQ